MKKLSVNQIREMEEESQLQIELFWNMTSEIRNPFFFKI